MLVDDHPMWIDALSEDLVAEGFEIVAVAHTGEECLRRARATRPEVIVMDLRIPDPDGALALSDAQVASIVNLVATSVPELDKSQVTVVDQRGNLLSEQVQDTALTMAGKQFDYSRRMEGMLTQRVHNILQPVLGNDRYKAEVSADLDFSAVESTSEQFNPDQPALRSEQSTNEQRTASNGPQGVPGGEQCGCAGDRRYGEPRIGWTHAARLGAASARHPLGRYHCSGRSLPKPARSGGVGDAQQTHPAVQGRLQGAQTGRISGQTRNRSRVRP